MDSNMQELIISILGMTIVAFKETELQFGVINYALPLSLHEIKSRLVTESVELPYKS